MPWAAIIPAVASVAAAGISAAASGSGSGGGTTEQKQQNTAPWGPQQAPVVDLLGNAQATMDSQLTKPYYSGPTYAGINQAQRDGSTNLVQAGQGVTNVSGGVLSTGASAANSALPAYLQNASGIAAGNFDHGTDTAGAVTAGNAGNMVGVANQGAQGALGIANGNTAGSNIAAASQYANNPYLTGQIDAALTDVRRNLSESILPGLNAQASAGGNLNSSRAGAAEAIARRGAEETAANTAAGMRSAAYQQGLGLAEQARQANLSGNLGAASVGNIGSAVGVQGQAADTTSRLGNQQIQLAGNTQLGTGATIGGNLAATGASLAQAGGNMQLQGGGVLQTDAQKIDDAALQNWTNTQQWPWTTLNNASGIIQNKNWGTSADGSSTASKTDSLLGNLIAGGTMGGVLGKQGYDGIMSWLGNSKPAALSGTTDPYSVGGDLKEWS